MGPACPQTPPCAPAPQGPSTSVQTGPCGPGPGLGAGGLEWGAGWPEHSASSPGLTLSHPLPPACKTCRAVGPPGQSRPGEAWRALVSTYRVLGKGPRLGEAARLVLWGQVQRAELEGGHHRGGHCACARVDLEAPPPPYAPSS